MLLLLLVGLPLQGAARLLGQQKESRPPSENTRGWSKTSSATSSSRQASNASSTAPLTWGTRPLGPPRVKLQPGLFYRGAEGRGLRRRMLCV